jgi:4,5-DOPA dioxygenase extradiol
MMPALFIGHGSPMNAIEETEFSRVWVELGRSLPRPKAIVCISAHWETIGSQITAMEQPRTIHDFYGFPQALFNVGYPASGSLILAKQIQQIIGTTDSILNYDWGLDHGCWSVLCQMFPNADIPVIQLSLDRKKSALSHYELGKSLRRLRSGGILIIGSGNIVHNLAKMNWSDNALEWAVDFNNHIKQLIVASDHPSIINYEKMGAVSKLAVPSAEHFLPLLYILGLQSNNEHIRFFNDKVTFGTISMLSLQLGTV